MIKKSPLPPFPKWGQQGQFNHGDPEIMIGKVYRGKDSPEER